MTVLPQIVVRDDPRAIVTYLPAGSVTKRRAGQRGGGPRGRGMLRWDGGYEDKAWTGTNVLMIHRPGEWFSVWNAWDAASGALAWRYINLEEPWRRIRLGFDSRDADLDLWAKPGSNEWNWKDEDELAWAVEMGRWSQAQADHVRRQGERAVDAVRRLEPPFDEDWSSWCADPAWTVATMPSGWERYEV